MPTPSLHVLPARALDFSCILSSHELERSPDGTKARLHGLKLHGFGNDSRFSGVLWKLEILFLSVEQFGGIGINMGLLVSADSSKGEKNVPEKKGTPQQAQIHLYTQKDMFYTYCRADWASLLSSSSSIGFLLVFMFSKVRCRCGTEK